MSQTNSKIIIDSTNLFTLTGDPEDKGIPVPKKIKDILTEIGEPTNADTNSRGKFGLQIPDTRYVLKLGQFYEGVLAILNLLMNPLGILSFPKEAKTIIKALTAIKLLNPNNGEQCLMSSIQKSQFSSPQIAISGASWDAVESVHQEIASKCKNIDCCFHSEGCKINNVEKKAGVEKLESKALILKSKRNDEYTYSVVI